MSIVIHVIIQETRIPVNYLNTKQHNYLKHLEEFTVQSTQYKNPV